MPNYTVIAACSKDDYVIGKDNKLPWKIRSEMDYFLRRIAFSPVVMGKNTCLGLKKPMNTGTNYVLTTDKEFTAEGFTVIHSIEELFEREGEREVLVVGGQSIYEQFIDLNLKFPDVYKMIVELSVVDIKVEGDTRFPIEKLIKKNSSRIYRNSSPDGNWAVYCYKD